MRKNILTFLILLVFILGLCPVYAESPISVIVNGTRVKFDAQPVIENGRVLVPVRAIFQALGAEVTWDEDARTATGVKGTRKIVIKVDSTSAIVNGVVKTLDMPATIRHNRTLVPLRFISESLGSIVAWDDKTRTATINDAGLKVSYIDVGHADSILVETPNGKSMLIDAGNTADGTTVVNYIKGEGLNKIDILLATNPYIDYVGGMSTVIKELEIGKMYMPDTYSNTFEGVLAAAKNKGIKVDTAKAGVNVDIDTDVKMGILAPLSLGSVNPENSSVVVKLVYKNNSFLFTSNAEKTLEDQLLVQSVNSLKADVVKVGCHGSPISATKDFLKAVSPKYAVISAGKGNSYAYPAEETLKRLNDAGAKVYRTDELGTVVASSDGNTIAFNKSLPEPDISGSTAGEPVNKDIVISNIDLLNESITITNKSSSEVVLTGWKIVSVNGYETFVFPKGFTLDAGASVKVTSGKTAYSSGGKVLKWTSSEVWNDTGDRAWLLDDQERQVSEVYK